MINLFCVNQKLNLRKAITKDLSTDPKSQGEGILQWIKSLMTGRFLNGSRVL